MEEIIACPICNSTQLHDYIVTRDFTMTKKKFSLKKCEGCNLLITTPRPQPDELGQYYLSTEYISHSKKANSVFDKIYLIARKFTLKSKTKLLDSYAGKKSVLDYGCGTGAMLAYLKKKGWKIAGVEPSNEARAIALEELSSTEIKPSLEETNGKFQVLSLWHVLEHIPNIREVLHNFKRVLEKDGIVIIAVPNPNAWESNVYKEFWAAYDTPRHLWHFNQKSIQLLAETAGYKLVNILPMKLDAFYISMLSEKYKNNGQLKPLQFVRGFLNGLYSNVKAFQTGEYSSLIYILKNEESQ
jgi:2-polyprenyl-3-methyl-5-hydroxy-6-metoxy-1,4-benzoquinol methylase